MSSQSSIWYCISIPKVMNRKEINHDFHSIFQKDIMTEYN
jgi:hypothetical protein